MRNALCHACDFEIVEPADKPAFDTLGKEFVEHDFRPQSYQQTSTGNYQLRVYSIAVQ